MRNIRQLPEIQWYPPFLSHSPFQGAGPGTVGLWEGSQIPIRTLFARIVPALSLRTGGEHWSTPERSLGVKPDRTAPQQESIPRENLGHISWEMVAVNVGVGAQGSSVCTEPGFVFHSENPNPIDPAAF